MQDEINSQIVALSIRTGKETARITTRVLQAAIRKYLQDHKQRNPTLTHGKQTVVVVIREGLSDFIWS